MTRPLAIIMLALATALSARADIHVDRLTIEGRADQPLGLDLLHPRLGWRLRADGGEQNVRQTRYHIQVGSDSLLLLREGRADLWDVEAEGDQSLYVAYEGKALRANQRCYWRVRVEGTCGYAPDERPDVAGASPGVAAFTTPWSPVGRWGVGLIDESGWGGRWIGLDAPMPWDVETEHSRLSARYYRTTWPLATQPIRHATLHIAGLGLYEAYLNGHRIGDIEMAPVPSDYTKSIHYNSFDVTDLILDRRAAAQSSWAGAEANCLGVTVSNGRFYTMQQQKKKYKINNFGYPTLRANLIIEYADGHTQRIVTDDRTWRMSCDGPIRSSNEYDGEIYDARREFTSVGPDAQGGPSWATAAYDRAASGADSSRWFAAERSSIPRGECLGNLTPPMRVVTTLEPLRIEAAGRRALIDFGQNFAGRVRIADLSQWGLGEGDTLRLRWAEKLADADGYTLTPASELYVANLRHAQSTDLYVASGHDRGSWAPRFCTHAGRFVEVTLLPAAPARRAARPRHDAVLPRLSAASLTGEVISDQMETLGSFECADELLTRLHRAAYWGILDNYKGMPVDCPQRDERMPWLGDRAMGCWGESYVLDNHSLYNKWLRDIAEAQRADGCIPDVAPVYWNYFSDNVTWPSVFVFGARMLYAQYGDPKAIETFYPAMRRWLLHFWQSKRDASGLITADRYGDWCVTPEAPELIHSQDPTRITDGRLIASCYFCRLLDEMTGFCDYLATLPPTPDNARRGYTRDVIEADRADYAAMRSAVAEAVNREFLHVRPATSPAPDHLLYPDSTCYANGAVTANLLPLAFGIVPPEHEETITRQLLAKILLNPAGGHLCCGVIGIQWLMRELSRRGRIDVAYLLATNETFPSWGYMLQHGATTIWELWNGDTANPAMNSGNHVMLLGDLLPWMYEHLGGIRAVEPAYRAIRLAPDFELEELPSASVAYTTPYGQVVSRWHKTLHRLEWDIEVPPCVTAEVVMPHRTLRLGSGRYHLDEELPMQAHVERDEFLYEQAPFPSCHAATIAECANGDLLAAYFGGSYESAPDVCIWTQRKRLLRRESDSEGRLVRNVYEEGWSEPRLVADGALEPQPASGWRSWPARTTPAISEFVPIERDAASGSRAAANDTLRKAAYNPVLFQIPGGDLLLFYKLGKDVRDWTGYVMRSADCGMTWTGYRDSIPASAAYVAAVGDLRLAHDSLLGAIKNQPIALPAGFRCADGTVLSHQRLLSPTSKETATASKVKAGAWRCHIEVSDDDGQTWSLGPVVPQDASLRTIQPALIVHGDGRVQMLCRTAPPAAGHPEQACIATSFSRDGGLTWSPMQLIEGLPNNNSGIDAVTVPASLRRPAGGASSAAQASAERAGKASKRARRGSAQTTDGSSAADTTPDAAAADLFALIYNPFGCVDWRDSRDPARNKPLRNPLWVATSADGLHWTPLVELESSPISQYSYPSMIVGSDGTLHCIYTWRRQRIKYQQIRL